MGPAAPSSVASPAPIPLAVFDGISGAAVAATGPSSGIPAAPTEFTATGYLTRDTLIPKDGHVALWPLTVDAAYVHAVVYDGGVQHLFRWDKPTLGITSGVWPPALAEIASTGTVTLSESTAPDIEVLVDSSDPHLVDHLGWASCAVGGQARYVISHCRVVLNSAAVSRSPIVTHELGHCLGLNHSSRPFDMMSPTQTTVGSFTEDERVLLTMMYRWRRPGNGEPDDDRALAATSNGSFVLSVVD